MLRVLSDLKGASLTKDEGEILSVAGAGGGQLLNGPMEVPGGDWIAQCLDPQGAAFAVHQVKA